MTTLKEAIAKKERELNKSNGDVTAFILERVDQIVEAKTNELKTEILSSINDEIKSAIADIKSKMQKGDPGLPGLRGPKGDSIKGEPGPIGPKPKAGKDYPIPQNGKTPKVGVDFFIPTPIPGPSGSPDKPIEIVDKLNKTKELVEPYVIRGLESWKKNISGSIREKSGKSGGGMGNWLHQNTATSSATTTVTITTKVAANGYAMLVRYNGKLLAHNVDYTLNNTTHVITFVGFTLDDNSFVDVTWVRA